MSNIKLYYWSKSIPFSDSLTVPNMKVFFYGSFLPYLILCRHYLYKYVHIALLLSLFENFHLPNIKQSILVFILKGRVHDFDFGFFEFFLSQHWLGTYERPSNPPRSSFYIVSEASYGRFRVPFLSRIHLD